MLIIDNLEYMRNGDYLPTRFEAQADAVNIVFQTKLVGEGRRARHAAYTSSFFTFCTFLE